jgi:hypothetical protein
MPSPLFPYTWEYNNQPIEVLAQNIANILVSYNISVLPYKVYTALLSQDGTNDPVAIVMQNTLGADVTWTRTSAGVYLGECIGKLTAGQTVIFSQGNNSLVNQIYPSINTPGDDVTIETGSIDNATPLWLDSILGNTFVEIRVYN